MVESAKYFANPRAFAGMEQNPWYISNTFAGSQLSCAASLASIEVYEQEDLLTQCREKGAFLLESLRGLVAEHGDVLREARGLGLWIGLECNSAKFGTRLADELFARDVLVAQTINNPNTLRIQPPLIITREQIEDVLAALTDSVKAVAANPVAAN